MRISDWSSDVCSSDLDRLDAVAHENGGAAEAGRTGADVRDFLLGPAHLGHVRTPALLERFVGDVLFNATDRYRAEAVIERARTFTQPILRTDTTADIRQRVGLMQIGRASCRERVCQYV